MACMGHTDLHRSTEFVSPADCTQRVAIMALVHHYWEATAEPAAPFQQHVQQAVRKLSMYAAMRESTSSSAACWNGAVLGEQAS